MQQCQDDDRNDRYGNHHINPSAGIARGRREGEQSDRMSHADARDDRDRTAAAKEERRPEDGPHIEDSAVTGARRRSQGISDQNDADRSEQSQRPAGRLGPPIKRAMTITAATITGVIAKLGPRGRTLSIAPSSAAPP